MGSNFAHDLADGTLDFHTALGVHLRANHYPPIPLVMVEPAIKAIEAYFEYAEDRWIDLPFDGERDGKPFQITWKGLPKATAMTLIENLHLNEFISGRDGDED
jgi:hypothetical protein